ncbi:phytanoyl-CoA dioxygenase family protein [Nonomuraea sp. NPDC049400]|uniref:phytanoyl-CoA dioxygenase family protein n=1 Tax=Nonomuraea sp. NPDC049400 TaxID=3364352 RepID=UPI0037AFEF9E
MWTASLTTLASWPCSTGCCCRTTCCPSCRSSTFNPARNAQLLHPHDGFYPVPRPRPELSVATVWAIDDFAEANGATVLIPGSHRWPDGRTPTDADFRLAAAMPAGSCVLFVGTLWHGGGANHSAAPRLAATAQYCQPWLRTQEAFTLSTSQDVARAVSEEIRRMLGYSIHPPFVGMVKGMHPKRLMDRRRLRPGPAPTTSQWPGIIARVLGGQRPHHLAPTKGRRFRYRTPYRLRPRRARLTLYELSSPSSAPRRSTSLRGCSASFVRRPRC